MRQAEASSGKIFLVPYTVQRILSYISYHITKTGTFVRHMHVGTHHLTLTLNLLRVYEDKPAGQRSKHSLQIWKKHSASQSADLVFILYFISGALIWDSTVVSTLSTLSFTPPWTMQWSPFCFNTSFCAIFWPFNSSTSISTPGLAPPFHHSMKPHSSQHPGLHNFLCRPW